MKPISHLPSPNSQRRLPRGTILNRQGQPIVALTAPSGGVNAVARTERLNAAREYLNPLRGLTISRAARLLEDYQLGRMADLQWTYLFAEQTDPDMIALLALRIGRVVEMDYNLAPEEEADEAAFERQKDHLVEKLAAIDNLYEGIEHLAMAPFRGYAHAEKLFNADGDIHHLEIVDQWNVVRDGMRGEWKWNPTARACDYGACSGPVLPLEKFLYRESRRPINRYALLKMIRASLSEKDWDAFNEIYNVPGGVVIGPPDVDPDDESEYETAAQRVAEGGSGYLPHGSTYVPNKMPHDPATFKQRLDYLSEKLVLAGTGGKLTMLAESGSGTLAGGAHRDVFDQIAAAEARRISEVINRQLVAPWLEEAFPGQPQLAYFALAPNEETDSGAAVEQVLKLAQAGYQVEAEQVTQKTGWVVTLKPAPDPSTLNSQLSTSAAAAEQIANRATSARFEAHAAAALNEADRARLAPLQARVDALRTAADPAAYAVALRELKGALPALERTIVSGRPELAAAFEQIFASAFANGMAEAASKVGRHVPVPALNNRQPAKSPPSPQIRKTRVRTALRAAGPGYRPVKAP